MSVEDFKQYTQVVLCAGGEVLSECSTPQSSLVMVENYAPALDGILVRLLYARVKPPLIAFVGCNVSFAFENCISFSTLLQLRLPCIAM